MVSITLEKKHIIINSKLNSSEEKISEPEDTNRNYMKWSTVKMNKGENKVSENYGKIWNGFICVQLESLKKKSVGHKKYFKK